MVYYTDIVLNVHIGPFAAKQLRHSHGALIRSPDQRGITIL